MIKDKNGVEIQVGDTLECISDAGLTLRRQVRAIRGTTVFENEPATGEPFVLCLDPRRHAVVSRADGSPPSATPREVPPGDAEDRYAPGSVWLRSVPEKAGPLRSAEWFIASHKRVFARLPDMDNGALWLADKAIAEDAPKEHYYAGNISVVSDFLIALTRACEGSPWFFESDTLPSPAPTGTYVAGGVEYDEIPSRYGEPDPDRVALAQIEKHRKAREEETAALGRFNRIEREVLGVVAFVAPEVTTTIDKVANGAALVMFRHKGERVQLHLESTFGMNGAIGEALDTLQMRLGARAMGAK